MNVLTNIYEKLQHKLQPKDPDVWATEIHRRSSPMNSAAIQSPSWHGSIANKENRAIRYVAPKLQRNQ